MEIPEKRLPIFTEEFNMRLACPEQRLDCLPISDVTLNLACRDEIIPILRALQHLYGNAQLRRELLGLVGKDVNQSTSRKPWTTRSELLGDRGAGGGAVGLQPGL